MCSACLCVCKTNVSKIFGFFFKLSNINSESSSKWTRVFMSCTAWRDENELQRDDNYKALPLTESNFPVESWHLTCNQLTQTCVSVSHCSCFLHWNRSFSSMHVKNVSMLDGWYIVNCIQIRISVHAFHLQPLCCMTDKTEQRRGTNVTSNTIWWPWKPPENACSLSIKTYQNAKVYHCRFSLFSLLHSYFH